MPDGCSDFAELPVNEHGVSAFLTAKPAGAQFRWLREAPPGPPPAADPLVPFPVVPDLRKAAGKGPDENYQLLRLSNTLNFSGLSTTTRTWPIAACSKNPSTRIESCKIGFETQGIIVEAQFFSPDARNFNQSDIWRVAIALDKKIRSIVAKKTN